MKTHTTAALGVGMLLVSVACNERESGGSAAPPANIEQMSVVDVVALADGGAYAIGIGEGLWYVCACFSPEASADPGAAHGEGLLLGPKAVVAIARRRRRGA